MTEPAFPFHGQDSDRYESHPGLTLRDYFAARAMQAAFEDHHRNDHIAQRAYAIADAMLTERGGTTAFDMLKALIQADDDMAWTWHCNIAMPFVDEGGSHKMANHAAARFMSTAFDVDVTKFVWWKDFEKQWEVIDDEVYL
jgi:hypothetical protein